MGRRVVIGITCKSGKDNFYLPKAYTRAILASGALPILLPVFKDDEMMEYLIESLDGLLLAGGGDIHPKFYNQPVQAELKKVNPERDEWEFQLLKRFKETGKPILGICRGIQVINVGFGGDLYQHIQNHYQKEPTDRPSHEIFIKEDTLLHRLLRMERIMVNSFHHQAIKSLASGFLVSAYAPDNTIEAIEDPEHPFLLGVQFHPEYMYKDKIIKRLFDGFVRGCSRD